MSEKNEKYPQIVLCDNGTYKILIANDVELKFNSRISLSEYIKDKSFEIKEGVVKHPKASNEEFLRNMLWRLTK